MVALGHAVTASPSPVAVLGCPGGSRGSRVPSGISSVTFLLPGSSSWEPRAGNLWDLGFVPQIQGSGMAKPTPVTPQGTWGRVWGQQQRVKGQEGPQKEILEKRRGREIPGIPRERGQDPRNGRRCSRWDLGWRPGQFCPQRGLGLWSSSQGMTPTPKPPGGFGKHSQGQGGIWGFWGVLALGGVIRAGFSSSGGPTTFRGG